MDALIQYFTSNIGTDQVWTAFLFLAVYYILKKEPFKIFAHFSERKEKEHELAKALLECGKIGQEAADFLREHLERTAFHKYYGIDADSEMRTALLEFHKRHRRSISWSGIRRAYPNIELVDSVITARLDWFEHILRWLVTAMCYVTSAYAIYVILYAIASVSSTTKIQFFGLTGAALVLLLSTVFFSTLNWGYHASRKVIVLSENSESKQEHGCVI